MGHPKNYSGSLSQENLRKLFSYDPESGVLKHAFTKNHMAQKGSVAGSPNVVSGYLYVGVKGRLHRVHRIVWTMVKGGIPDGFHIDHINGNRTDNRIANLRLVTNHENHKNMRMRKDNKSGITGVYWSKSRAKWEAEIRLNGKKIYLGRFLTKREAEEARIIAERRYGFHPNHGRAA